MDEEWIKLMVTHAAACKDLCKYVYGKLMY